MQMTEKQIKAIRDAIGILRKTQILLDDWWGPAGRKVAHAYEYLSRVYVKPYEIDMLADEHPTEPRDSIGE